MTTIIAPKLNIGDTFYCASTERELRELPCPDCLGEKLFKVLAPSGDEFAMDCPRCSGNSRLRDVPSLKFDVLIPKVLTDEIVSYCVNEYGEQGVKYRGRRFSVSEAEIITDEVTAKQKADQIAAKANAELDAEPKRIHHKNLGGLELREAAQSQFENGLYDGWSCFRYLRETVDEIIEDEGSEYGSRSEIVHALEERLSTTHRYDFVFKGFPRAMEAVVALVNAGEAEQPAILQALREQWAKLPEAIQKTWQPNERIATDWSGKTCPTY